MKTNVPNVAPRTHEGAPAIPSSPFTELRRAVMACLLWESSFYESGVSIADRIRTLVPKCDPAKVAALAIEARESQRLRHVPLLLCRELARDSKRFRVADTLARVIQRADELAEFVSLYWLDGKKPLSAQVKKGLAAAFQKFDEYQLAKYDRAGKVRLRDVLFLCHAKPKDKAQADLWKRLAQNELATPDTWEVALSGGADKRETFTRLINEKNLGYMALLRNLRNMADAGVDPSLVFAALAEGAAKSKALPFRFVAAARACPQWEPQIDAAMQVAATGLRTLPGSTVLLVDISPSMNAGLSQKSDLSRVDAACALAVLCRAVCDRVRVFSFSSEVVEVPPRSGMALADAIKKSQPSNGTLLGKAIRDAKAIVGTSDRLIVITDEESQDAVGGPFGRGYMLNVATSANGVGYGDWTRISGWSESVVQYIAETECAP